MSDADDRLGQTMRDIIERGSQEEWDLSPDAIRKGSRTGWLRIVPRTSHIGLVAAVVALIVAGSLVGFAASSTSRPTTHARTGHNRGHTPRAPIPSPTTTLPSLPGTVGPTTTVVPPTTTSPPTTTTPPTTPPSSTTTSTVVPVADLPTVTIGTWTGIEPAIIYFSGDAGDIATGLTWPVWNQTEAIGHGMRNELSCVPDCAAGTATPYPVTITLSNPVNGAFTTLVEQTSDGKGTTETFTAPYFGDGACSTSNENSCKFSN